jgi:signal transduction histidine kinase
MTRLLRRMLSALRRERAGREEIERLAGERAALRRVATLVARAAAPGEIFAAVAEEVAQLSGADVAVVLRYETDGAATVLGCWSGAGLPAVIGTRLAVAGEGVAVSVLRTGRPARAARLAGPPGSVADWLRRAGMRAGRGSPVVAGGRLWGVVITATARPGRLHPETERRQAAFAGLAATAIATAQARAELRAIAGEQAALRRVAALVARGAAPGAVFAAVAEEAGHVLPEADVTMVARYDPDRAVEVAGGWGRAGGHLPVGRRSALGGQNVSTLVFQTGQAARVDDLAGGGAVTVAARQIGMRSAAGAPISVEGRLWGVMIVASARETALPSGTEHRLAAFTELIATAVASAQARAELTASRARIVATADETRRRIERDLHDGAQQQLVSLALRLLAAQETVPPELETLRAELGRVAAGLTDTLDELREYARGIHPAILAHAGLAPALKTLARRSPLPVTLDVQLAGRLPERVEVTAYYVVSEALANAAKHAGASAVHVGAAAAGDVIRLAVRDDGIGGADPARGSGLAGLKDRVEAIGGTWSIRSRPGEGTTLLAELPARPAQPAPAAGPDSEAVTLTGPGAPDGGHDGRARTRVPQSRKCAPPDPAHVARPARLTPGTWHSPRLGRHFIYPARVAAAYQEQSPWPRLPYTRPSPSSPLRDCGSQG